MTKERLIAAIQRWEEKYNRELFHGHTKEAKQSLTAVKALRELLEEDELKKAWSL